MLKLEVPTDAMRAERLGFREGLVRTRTVDLRGENGACKGIEGSCFGVMESNVGRERRFLGVVWRLNG